MIREFIYLGNRAKVHADAADTRGRFAMMEFWSRPGTEPPLHSHDHEDELFYVVEGRMKLVLGGEEQILEAGESAIAPRGTPHTFHVISPALRSFAVFAPAGFEEFFRALAGDPPPPYQRIAEVAGQFGARLL